MDKELHDKLLFILDRCNDTQRDLTHIKRLLFILREGFENCGFDGNEYGVSTTYIIEKMLDMILDEYLDLLETTVCEVGGFRKRDWE